MSCCRHIRIPLFNVSDLITQIFNDFTQFSIGLNKRCRSQRCSGYFFRLSSSCKPIAPFCQSRSFIANMGCIRTKDVIIIVRSCFSASCMSLGGPTLLNFQPQCASCNLVQFTVLTFLYVFICTNFTRRTI